jgi:hypothetical protein
MTNQEQTSIHAALLPLVGLPLWAAGRVVNLIWLQFGSRRTVLVRAAEREVGEYALHMQCSWRLRSAEAIIVGSADRLVPRSESLLEPDDFDWTEPGANRCDELLEQLFVQTESYDVLAARADAYGGFSLELSSGLVLDVFIDGSPGNERWRLFKPWQDDEHFVMEG